MTKETIPRGAAPVAPAGTRPGTAQANAPAALECRDLSVGYDGRTLVAGVGFAVAPGQIVTLIGPNGAGKSTILKTAAGQLPVLGGAVLLRGRRLEQVTLAEQARERAVLLTERPHTDLLTCADVVAMGRYPFTGRLGILSREDEAIVREAMDMAQVADLAHSDFMQLSDGQRQRVMLARALCQQPRLLVLDEPTSYLDIRYQVELLDLLRRLCAERGLAVVMSLHELSLARQVSDWVVGVRDGAIVAQGTPWRMFGASVINALFGLRPGMYDEATTSIVLGRDA